MRQRAVIYGQAQIGTSQNAQASALRDRFVGTPIDILQVMLESKRTGRARRKAVLELGRARAVDIVLVKDAADLADTVAEAIETIAELEKNGVRITTFEGEPIALPSSDSPRLELVNAALQEFRTAIQADRVREGMRIAKEKGVKLGRKPSAGNGSGP